MILNAGIGRSDCSGGEQVVKLRELSVPRFLGKDATMKSKLIVTLALAVVGVGSEFALGQSFAPPTAPRAQRPTLSPYLNLLNRNNSPAFNYYNRVRPRQAFDDYQQQTARNLSSLERRIEESNQAIQQSQNSQLAPTGQRVRFMDLGGYFGTGAGQFGGGGGGSVGRR